MYIYELQVKLFKGCGKGGHCAKGKTKCNSFWRLQTDPKQ